MRTIGVDFSINGPGICVHTGDEWSVNNCKFLFLTSKKKWSGMWWDGRIDGLLIPEWTNDTLRFLTNAFMIKNWLHPTADDIIGIEGYSFGSKGHRAFSIGEATGILKTLLIHDTKGAIINGGANLLPFAPGAIKKSATGKGNAVKEDMVEAFFKQTNVNLLNKFGMKTLQSPVHDLVDSYFLCKLVYDSSSERDLSNNVDIIEE